MQASATENYLLFSTWNSTRLTKEKWGVLTQKKVKNYYITDITCLWWNSNLDRPSINTSIPFSPNLTFNWLCKHSNLRDKNTIPHFSWLFILYQLFTKKKFQSGIFVEVILFNSKRWWVIGLQNAMFPQKLFFFVSKIRRM